MSQENVELVHQALEALERRDRTTWLAVHDEDFEVVPIREFPEVGVRGSEATWDFYVEMLDAWDGVSTQDTELVDAGADKV